MTFELAIEQLLTAFGGTNYKKMTLDEMKLLVKETLEKVKAKGPELAIVTKFTSKTQKQKTKESLLMIITEQLFTLSGETC